VLSPTKLGKFYIKIEIILIYLEFSMHNPKLEFLGCDIFDVHLSLMIFFYNMYSWNHSDLRYLWIFFKYKSTHMCRIRVSKYIFKLSVSLCLCFLEEKMLDAKVKIDFAINFFLLSFAPLFCDQPISWKLCEKIVCTVADARNLYFVYK